MTEREQLEQAIAHLEAQRAALGNAVVDASIAALRRQLAEKQAPTPELRGERKPVTVLFADISGFTAMAERMDPESVRERINACFNHLVPVIEKYEGTVDKFIGDEIMALFGAPVAHENDPERALRAALEMKEALASFNAEHGTDLGIHFGINTGLVIAGGIGSKGRQEYTVMGDATNLASRLEEISGRGEILVGPHTRRLTAPLFEFKALEPVLVKGKAQPVSVYRLLGLKAVPGQVRGIAGLGSPLVGREAELRALGEAIDRLRDGVGGVVTLVGEAGLGKSRLVAEATQHATRNPKHETRNAQPETRNTQWVEGRCLSYGTSIAYLLWLDVLRGLLGATAEDTPTAVRDALRERIQVLCPDSFEDVYPYLAQMMSLPDEALPDGSPDLEGERLKSGIFHGVASTIEGAARKCPLVVVCEDLHWADPTSIELLEQLLVLTERVPLLFICIFRPQEERGCWRIREAAARLERHTDLWLDPLSTAESEALVGNLLHVEGLPQQLKERILGHSEGNPFYVEEILRSLIDSGAIAHDEATGRWRATRDVAEIAIPDTLHGVLMARIDRLQEDTKRVLQLASVIGRIFFHRVLAEIARQERTLGEHLLALQREEMIRERARVPELAYIFKHHLTQKAAYTSLLKKERRVYHRQVAQALERLFPDNVEEQIGLLAYHWERAEEPEKAAAYLVRAGDQARLAYAHQEAIDFYQRALAFLREGQKYDQAARTLMKLGLTHHNAFDFGRSRQAYEEGFALWQRVREAQEGTRSPPAPHALRVVWNEPLTLDPTIATDGVSALMIDQLFSGLMERSPEMNVTPGVAQSWEVLEGGRKYVFHLRDDVRWSDGAPVTAQDFEYAWVRALDPATASPIASLLYGVKGARVFHQGETLDPGQMGVRALDEVTLVVELEEPTGHFLSLVARCPCCYPLPRHAVAAHGEAWTQVGHIVTNGAFQVRSWQRGESMLLVRNPAYHGRVGGNVQRVALSFPTRPPSRLEVYQADDVDIVNLSGLPPADMDRARRQHAGEFVSVPDPATYYAGFDASRPPFDDPRVRRAFVQAADRETLVGVVQRGYYLPATGGFIPSGMPGHSPAIGLPYDPGKARQLLAKAGYPDGRGFPTVDWVVWRTTEAYREYLQAQWRENLGVEIASQSMEWGAYLARLDRELPHMFFMGWIADYPDPDVFLRVGIRQFQVGWRNQAYERLVEEARRVTDQGERIKLYQKADRILIKEAAIMPIAYSRSHLLVKPWVSKFPVAAVQDWFWKDLVVEPYKRL